MKVNDMSIKDQAAFDVYLDILVKEADPYELRDYDLDYIRLRMDIIKNYCNEIIKLCDNAEKPRTVSAATKVSYEPLPWEEGQRPGTFGTYNE